jgi:hypothetical protein
VEGPLKVNSCWNEFECVNECFFLFCFVVFLCFVCFRMFCLCAPIKWSLIGVEKCVREGSNHRCRGKFGERGNVVSLMSVVVVANGRIVVVVNVTNVTIW